MRLTSIFCTIVIAMLATIFCATFGVAHAQTYPRKPIAFVVPYGAGSGNDVIARIVAKKLTESWGTQVVVVNRPGATGGIALEMIANAAPDGYSMVIASTSQIINQHLSKMRYDFLRDFAPVSLSGSMPYAVVVLSSYPAKSLKDLVAIAKANPGKLNYSGTIGSIAHFMGEMLKSSGGIDIVMIPNKLAGDTEVDVLAGRIEIWISTLSTALKHAKTGRVRVLGVAGDKRAVDLPTAPTMVEAGFPKLDVVAGYFILVPLKTPKPTINIMNREFVKALADKDVRERLAAVGVEPTSSTPEELGALIKSEVARWGAIVKESGIRLE